MKFKAFREYEIANVNNVADLYNAAFMAAKLDGELMLPEVKKDFLSSWAQYTIQLSENIDRAALQSALKKKNIPTMIYYMRPMHMQGAFEGTDSAIAECPVTERLCRKVLSLPMHPYMTEAQVNEIVNEFFGFVSM